MTVNSSLREEKEGVCEDMTYEFGREGWTGKS